MPSWAFTGTTLIVCGVGAPTQKRGYKIMVMQILSPFFFILALYVMNEVLSSASKEHLYDDRTEPSRHGHGLSCRVVCHSPLEQHRTYSGAGARGPDSSVHCGQQQGCARVLR
jgi:hypothetical protein